MVRLRNVLFNVCFAINCLLLLFLLFESRLVVPAWLQVTGRMHPLLLHFPIVLLILYFLWSLFIERKSKHADATTGIGEWLLLFTALTASLTALAGLFLSREGGYDVEALQPHKWSGVAIAFITTIWYAFRNKINKANWSRITIASAGLFIIVLTGHLGAGITHGENYLLAPLTPETTQPKVLLEEAVVYTHMVKPIFQSKCMGCHNSSKAKGDLVMETKDLLLKGGKNGKLWDSTAAGYGLLLNRLHLPMDNKKHMPPAGKPQLEEQEMEILSLWIKSGADFTTRVAELPDSTPLRLIANAIFNTIETDNYTFAAADEKKVEALNSNYRVVSPLAQESPALSVSFFGAQFYKPEQLKELLEVKTQVVNLNMDKMPVKDEELTTISQFSNLRKLNLSFTSITGSNVEQLKKLNDLRQISFSGTGVTKESLLSLASLKHLSHLYVWNTKLTEPDIASVKETLKNVIIETGFTNDTSVLQLPPPVLVNTEPVVKVPLEIKLKHPINGVSIRYTLDGTEPDSLKSPEYTGNISITKNGLLKARAFKPGWSTSKLLENYFYTSTYKPDSAVILTKPEDRYKGNGAQTLTDLAKGEVEIVGGDSWLGFRSNRMEALLFFKDTVHISNVTLGTLVNIGGFIMPAASVELWGGSDATHLKKLSSVTPKQPTETEPAYLKAIEINVNPVTVKCLKLVVQPVSKLPKWHGGKGQKAWFFIDEVFVN